MNGECPEQPIQTSFPIDFLVVGGGLAGLSCAIALRRVGHRVLVLEKDKEDEVDSGGCRLPPNVTKILFHWGLQEKLRSIAVESNAITFHIFETGELMGTHVWDREFIEEVRGHFVFSHHAAFRTLLYDTAVSYGAKIRRQARVVEINAEERSVTLAGGETLHADVVIAADGPHSLGREQLLKEEGKFGITTNSSGLMMFNTTVPRKLMMSDPKLRHFCEQGLKNVWYGHGRCALGFPVGPTGDFALHIYVPHDGSDLTWYEKSTVSKLLSTLDGAEPCLKSMAKLATPPACISVKDVPELDSWVHESGRMVLVGEAAHPLVAGGIQGCAMAIEDAAVLAKIFSHLRREDQISTFLYAFPDIRQERVAMMLRNDTYNNVYLTLPQGEQQQLRDDGMRRLTAQGVNVMEIGETSEPWEDIKTTFSYDCEDEADNWWVKWGLLREHADGHIGTLMNFSVTSFQVLRSINPRSIFSHEFFISEFGCHGVVFHLGDGHFLYPGRQHFITPRP